MKTAIILSAVAGLVSSVSAQDYFGMLALHSASPIHYGEIHAQGQSLWIGKKTQKYCPDSVQTQGGCPKGKGTNFAGDNGGLSMGAIVPGGQQVYIDRATGQVHYTQAHSADTHGGITGGWKITKADSIDTISHPQGLFACSVSGDEDEGPWQIYAKVKGVPLPKGCLGFDGLVVDEKKALAWQYT